VTTETELLTEAVNGAPIANGPVRVHTAAKCEGERCPFHNPGEHPLNRRPILIRFDRDALVERLCEHVVGHPDPDSVRYFTRVTGDTGWGLHGCDSCCRRELVPA
jgi:hypothetical protein